MTWQSGMRLDVNCDCYAFLPEKHVNRIKHQLNITMFKNYLKTAWRNIKKNKGFFTLNFIGLYISVVACLLIGLIILHETSFDKPKNNTISVYRIVKTNM